MYDIFLLGVETMNIYELKEDIIEYAHAIGIQEIGFATPDPFTELKGRLQEHQDLGYSSGFEKGTIEERTEPSVLFPKVKSMISIALAYPSKIIDAPRGTKEARRGIFCRASWGVDYHFVLRDKLRQLADYIKTKEEAFECKIMVDTGELNDGAVAERAGIGFVGKNTMIITKNYGSWVYIGEMLTNLPFPSDTPVEDGCGDCNRCIDACPTGAIVQAGQVDAHRCLSYITQTKNFIDEPFREKLGTRIYGCDTCQAVCPYNRGIDHHLHEDFEPDPEVAKPLLKPLLKISNREFREKFGPTAGAWRGKKPLQRNAIIALAHFKDKTAIPDLSESLLEDVRPAIRGTAAWSLGKIGSDEAFNILSQALEKEEDEQVIYEIEAALNKLEAVF